MRKTLLLILDGLGHAAPGPGNAVTKATLPRLFELMERHGHGVLEAAGPAVGLEPGQVGNSEAGHMTIGAGEVIPSMTRRILNAYEDGSWAADPAWKAIAAKGPLHVVGLVSDAGVHAFVRTLIHAVHTAVRAGVGEIVVHPVLDGVDSKAGSAPALLAELRTALDSVPEARLGVIQGRARFCDRSGSLDVSRAAADAFRGALELPPFTAAALEAHLARSSEADFPPHLFAGGRAMAPGEPVLHTSNRADRARQIVKVLGETQPIYMLVDPGADVPCEHVFFPQRPLERGLYRVFRESGLRSQRIAEKCKFPHVTFFFNGFDAAAEGDGTCIPSIHEKEIPAHPEMSAREVTDTILAALASADTRVVVANLANLDQVGHLGNFELAQRAAAEVDDALGRIMSACDEHGWSLLVTGDHGNADQVSDADGKPHGSHTEAPVPLAVRPAPGLSVRWLATDGSLANVAATTLAALGLDAPAWMEPALATFE